MADATPKDEEARKAWRTLLVPLVGSSAFFASSLTGVIKTYSKYGGPNSAFTLSDYFLLSLPFLIVPLTLHETFLQTKEAVMDAVE